MLEIYMERLRRGDISALEFIYNETKNSVFAIALGIIRDYSLAEDIMQDTFIKVKKYIGQFKEGTSAKRWINAIARNTSLNLYNRRKREAFAIDDSRLADCGIPDTLDGSGLFKTVFRILSHEESEIVIMHVLGGLKLSEIADMLKKPRGTVRWQYNNALKKLRKKFEKEGL